MVELADLINDNHRRLRMGEGALGRLYSSHVADYGLNRLGRVEEQPEGH